MATIKQDYVEWKQARRAFMNAKCELNKHFNKIVGKLSVYEWGHNKIVEAAVLSAMPDPETNRDDAKQYLQMVGKTCHAYPCFYMMCNPFDIYQDKEYIEKQADKCMNNHEDGTIYEAFCGECPAFKDFVKYQSLKAQAQFAQKKQETAKQKLLNNFRFWKQKIK